jgi:hypothetical protein
VVAQGEEGVLVGDGDERDVSAPAADAAVRPAFRDVGLTAEADAPSAAVTKILTRSTNIADG